MSKKPVLFFPQATDADYTKGGSPPIDKTKVNPGKQGKKFKNDWDKTLAEFTNFHLANDIEDSVPEMVLVLELRSTVDEFYKSVKQTEELQFLAYEFDFTPTIVENAANEDEDGLDPEYPSSSRVFLTLQNEASMQKILSLWKDYTEKRDFEFGTSQFKQLFKLLTGVRLYSVEDRLRDTGFREHVAEMVALTNSPVLAEVELLFITKKHTPAPKLKKDGTYSRTSTTEQDDLERTDAVYQRFKSLVERNGGRVLTDSYCLIPEIHYHAVAAELPLELLYDLTNNTEVELLKAPEVIFFRPLGQSLWPGHPDEEDAEPVEGQEPESAPAPRYEEPIAALLDGLPIQNHSAVAGRLTIDIDGVNEALYPADQRYHGTAMASLITRGDLSDASAEPLHNTLYVRPIMVLEPGFTSPIEQMPSKMLPVDVIHRAVKRLFEGEGEVSAVAPSVKIINLSIGDISRPFHQSLSAWARLLDWLSCKYDVLFIISAGNVLANIELPVPVVDFDRASPEERELMVLDYIISDNINRKVLTPSEAINAITVGAAQTDAGPDAIESDRYILVLDKHLMSPISRIGFGYRGSIKPDILVSGGRKCYKKHMNQPNPAATTLLLLENLKFAHRPPGISVAIPGQSGSLSSVGYQWGTSSATALATRLACQLHEMLDGINMDRGIQEEIPHEYYAVLIKSLLVHGASWQQSSDLLHSIVKYKPGVPPKFIKKHISPYLGYGVVDDQRVLSCTDNRVTLLGWGELETEHAHEFVFPLPEALDRATVERRLTITLAWISPTNWQSRQYRQARLYIDNITGDNYVPKGEQLTLERKGIDWKTTRRGTVQHDILVGSQADPYINGGELIIKIDCRKDAPGLNSKDTIRYGLAVTLEVNENTGVKIYEEIKQKLAVLNPIRPRP
ncbi:MAG TPA: S8 family peptidase [Hymenobacter sp.]|jgi:hypothetical protein|uniref:S8 family peptidase n=1 Tax=Hymenobacter sp. TaxID=1898978 RepID=UPI002ED98ACB